MTYEFSKEFMEKVMSLDCSGTDYKLISHFIINGNVYGPRETWQMIGISKAQYYRSLKKLRSKGLLDENNNVLQELKISF